jgi:hypothetical protein
LDRASTMTRRAACTCGQLVLICHGDPVRVSMCHCLACQRRTGSAFGIQARFEPAQVTIEGGSTRYQRTGDSGSKLTFHFCPACGSTVYWQQRGNDLIAVAIGTFADPEFPPPAFSVYEARRHKWTTMPALSVEHMD